MHDNIIATIIFILAICGIIALVVYKLRKDNNNEKVTVESFLDLYHTNLFNVLQDVVSLLSINIDDFETKEEYERTIISTTIEKLEENCDEFGISSALLKLVDREVLTNILYDILYTNKVQIFFSTLPEKIIKSKPELYDNEVIEAFENAQPVLGEDENTHIEPQEEPKHEEEEVTKQEEKDTDVSDNEKNEETEAETESVDTESTDTDLPPREVYYGKKNDDVKLTVEDVENAEVEIVEPSALNNVDEEVSELESLGSEVNNDEIFTDSNTFTTMPDPIERIVPIAETSEELASLADLPNADVDSAMNSINATLIRENVDHD